MKKIKAFCSWSGGKDSALALWVAKNNGFEISYLLNMTSSNGEHSRSHGIKSACLKKQSQALGIPIVQPKVSEGKYEETFKNAVLELKKEGIAAGVFGDIDFIAHGEWVERICKECGIKAYLPLWKRKREELLNEFIEEGFETIVVATKADLLSKDWLGRKIDKKFIEDLKKVEGVDLCGESGEYHTFVINCPVFKQRIELDSFKKVHQGNRWLLDINM